MHAKGLVTTVAVATLLAQGKKVKLKKRKSKSKTVFKQNITPSFFESVFADDVSGNNVAVAGTHAHVPAVDNEVRKNSNVDQDFGIDEDVIDKHDIAEQVKEAAERGKEAGEKFEEAMAQKEEMEEMAAAGKFEAQGDDDDEEDIIKAAGVESVANNSQSASPAEQSVSSDKKKDDDEEDDEEEEEDEDFDADAHQHASSAVGASSSASASFLGAQSSGLPLSFMSASGTAASAKAGAQPTVKAKNAKSGGNIVRVSIGATVGAVLIAAYTLL